MHRYNEEAEATAKITKKQKKKPIPTKIKEVSEVETLALMDSDVISDDDFVKQLCKHLKEFNRSLFIKVVTYIGREHSILLYKRTAEI